MKKLNKALLEHMRFNLHVKNLNKLTVSKFIKETMRSGCCGTFNYLNERLEDLEL